MLKLILIVALSALTRAQCGPGCLQCSSSSQCRLCDPTTLTFLRNGTCVPTNIPNCVAVDLSGKCTACAGPFYYLDPSAANCTALLFTEMILFCAKHTGPKKCAECDINFFLDQGECKFATNPVPFCQVQKTADTCQTCMTNYYLSAGGKECLPMALQANCSQYSTYTCTSCGEGYYLNSNLFASAFRLDGTSSPDSLQSMFSNLFSGASAAVPPAVCQKVPPPNCASVDGSGNCSACSPGYARAVNGTCAEIILNMNFCSRYLMPNYCVECNQGYRLTNPALCEPVATVPSCNTYNSTSNITECLVCMDGMFVQNATTCAKRINQDPNCAIFETKFDRCRRCLPGFVLSTDARKCLAEVSGCTSYADLTGTSPAGLVCLTCNSTTYLETSSNSCRPGNSSNCLAYVNDFATQCRLCQNGFYNLNLTCQPSRSMVGCQTYSQTSKNTCDLCNNSTIKTQVVNQCLPIVPIPNCAIYSGTFQCQWCALGFYLTSVSSCVQIPATLNCLNYTGTLCLQCKPDYVLTSFGTCRTAVAIHQTNCNATNITGKIKGENEGCTTCAAGAYPLDYFQWFYCIETWYLPAAVTAAMDANCQNWKIVDESTSYICVQCKAGFFLATSTTCTASCAGVGLTTIYNYIVPTKYATNLMVASTPLTVNTCGTTISGCAYASPLVPQTTAATQYVCTKCVATQVGMVVITNTNVGLFPLTASYMTAIRYNVVVPEVTCPAEATKGLLYIYSNTTKLTPNCEYYYDLPFWDVNTGCLKCQWGYTGRVVDYIANCDTYTNIYCTKCRAFNYPITSTVCRAVWPIPYCKTFDQTYTTSSCTVCDNGYYLHNMVAPLDTNAFYCEACTVQAGCSIYSQTADACTTCLTTHYLISGTCYLLPTNCITMVLNSGVAQCSACNSAVSYLDASNNCITGTVTHCGTYSASADTCTACTNGYYLASATSCIQQPANPSCQTHSQSTSGVCDTCSYDSFKFTVINTCTAVTTIANCATYATTTTCSVCNTGFQLSTNMDTCTAISASLNCQTYAPLDLSADGSITTADQITGPAFLYSCSLCSSGYQRFATSTSYTLVSGGTGTVNVYTCVSYFNFVTQNCAGNNNDGTITFPAIRCTSGCSSNYLPVDWTGLNMCVETAYLTALSATVTNCFVYYWSSGTSSYQCSLCANGYFRQSNTCVSSCTGSNLLHLWTLAYDATPSPTYVRISGRNVCQSISQSNIDSDCSIVAPPFRSAHAEYACVTCKTSTKYPLIGFAYDGIAPTPSDFKNVDSSLTGTVSAPLLAYPGIYKCIDTTVATSSLGTVDATTRVANCAYFGDLSYSSTSQYGCVRCNLGYSGAVIQDANSNKGYIQSCSADATCDTSTTYTGFQGNDAVTKAFGSIFSLFSCHKCTSASSIPVAFVEMDLSSLQVTGLRAYTIPNSSGVSLSVGATGSEQNHVRCLNPSTASNLGMTSMTTVSNCGLMIVNVIGGFDASGLSGTDSSKMAALCVACSPGYYPTYSTQSGFGHVITACTSITNCPANKGVWFNSCSTCSVFGVLSSSNLADYSTCTTNSISNCFVGTSSTCKACKNGYSLSKQNTCVTITAPYCTTSNVFSNDYLALVGSEALGYAVDGTATPYFAHQILTGCTSCAAQASTVLVKLDPSGDTNMKAQTCSLMTGYYVSNASPFSTTNCLRYGFDSTGSIKCLACSTGYLLTEIYSCVDATTYPNCLTVDSTTLKCSSCSSATYILVNYVCTLNSPAIITNCVAYTTVTATSATATCQTCASYFTPSADRSTCTAISSTTFPNCLQVDFAQTVCTSCASFFVLVAVASGSYCYPIGQISGTTPTQPDHDNNCLTYRADSSTTNSFQYYKLTCTSCKTGYIVTTTNTYTSYCYKFFVTASQTAHCSSFYSTQPELETFTFECLACSPVTTYYLNSATKTCTARTAITNCQTYSPDANVCQTCNSGYYGSGSNTCWTPFIPKNTLPNNYGYIENCVSMTTCDATKYYGGLSYLLQMIFSCHACQTATNIPFVFITGGSSYTGFAGLKEYGISAATPPNTYSGNVNGTSVACLAPAAASFQLAAAKFNFPTNCGLGMVNVDSPLDATSSNVATNVDPTKMAVFCVACAPKYSPTGGTFASSATVPLYISSCTTIANCATSVTFNACDICSNGYSLLYTAGTGIIGTSCIQYTANPNCLAAVTTSGPCQICKQGYYINRDGICESLASPGCTTPYAGIGLNSIEMNVMLTQSPLTGCNVCGAAYYSLYSPKHLNICTASAYLAAQNPASSNYVPNCAVYSSQIFGSVLVCAKCVTGYILTVDSRCVALVTALANCFVASTASQCAICNPGFPNVDYACVAPVIQNCLEYYPFSTGFQQCLVCGSGYFLQNNQCFAGPIPNCLTYRGYDECLLCQTGFMLTLLSNQTTRCFPVNAPTYCQLVDYDLFKTGTLKCVQCVAGFVPIPLAANEQFTHCYDFPKDVNCRRFDIGLNIQTSTFGCLECVDQYFLSWNQGSCFPRMKSFANCDKRNPTADTCDLCAADYILDTQRSGCVPVWNLAPNCIQFDPAGKCVLCVSGYYLNNTLCTPVTSSKAVGHCQYYDVTQACIQCISGYFVQNNTCLQAVATNCATYRDAKTCLACEDGFGLKTDNGVTNCVPKNAANCVKSTNYFPFYCVTCESGYYRNGQGTCSIVTSPVPNCRYYDGDGLCQTCFDLFILASNRLSCVPRTQVGINLEANCQAFETSDAGICSACADGFYFVDGGCVACSTGIAGSCKVCDPDSPQKCLVCSIGFYQLANGTCLPNSQILNTTAARELPAESPKNVDQSSGESRLRLLVLLVLIFAFGML